MGNAKEGCGIADGLNRMGRERLETLGDKGCIAFQLPGYGRIQVLQTPSGNNGIETENDRRGEDSHVADDAPCTPMAYPLVGAGCIGSTIPAYDKLCHHAGNA